MCGDMRGDVRRYAWSCAEICVEMGRYVEMCGDACGDVRRCACAEAATKPTCAASFHMEAMMNPDLAVHAGGISRWSEG